MAPAGRSNSDGGGGRRGRGGGGGRPRGGGGGRQGQGRGRGPPPRGGHAHVSDGAPPGGQPPPGRLRAVSECDENSCPVCLNRMRIFSVGRCNHHICSECSTRLRVLLDQHECPICRQDMPKVIQAESRRNWEDVHDDATFRMDRRSRICFETRNVEAAFHKLLEHRCPKCVDGEAGGGDDDGEGGGGEDGGEEEGRRRRANPTTTTFRTFKQLDLHMRRDHELHYCDLCVEHLLIFTHERRHYSRSDLATHRRKGDPDDTSHRGHPLCEFCQSRFLDKDTLFQHLRRDHFFCHFCDADGLHHFYDDYPALREHFKAEHFHCVEGDCVNEQFTSAFRSEIDLKAHRVERHSGALSKNEAKQNRVVGLELNYSRPGARDQASRRRGREASPEAIVDQLDGPVGRGRGQFRAEFSENNFPSLGNSNGGAAGAAGAAAAAAASGGNDNLARRLAMSSGHNVQWRDGRRVPNEQDFPSLPGSAPGAAKPSSSAMYNGAKKKTPAQQKKSSPVEDFPSLGGPSQSRGLSASFRPQASAPIYRTSVQEPAWSGSDGAVSKKIGKAVAPAPDIPTEDDLTNEKAKKSVQQQMVVLKKQPRSNNGPVNEQDFPGLGAPSQPAAAPAVQKQATQTASSSASSALGAATQKGKKSKKKGSAGAGGKLLTELVSGGNGSAGLQSAADLIFVEDKKKSKPPATKNKSEDDDSEEWTKVNATPKPSRECAAATTTTKNGNGAIPGLNFDTLSMESKRAPDPVGRGSEARKDVPKTATAKAEEDFPNLGPSSKNISANFRPSSSKTDVDPSKVYTTASNVARSSQKENSQPGWSQPQPAAKGNNRAKKDIDDFPSLGPSSKKISANFQSRPSSGSGSKDGGSSWSHAKAPPPGFSVTKGAPPPGFSQRLSSSMTYQRPNDFDKRNIQLVTTITGLIGGKSLEFAQFKDISSRFRAGSVSCMDYYAKCLQLFNPDTFFIFLPELLALLPDIAKQQELMSIHQKKFSRSQLEVSSCPICGQLLSLVDVADHTSNHDMDQDFPML